MLSTDPDSRAVVRHLMATLAYRAAKVIRGAPPGFGALAFGEQTRTPGRIMSHLGDLMTWATTLARGDYLWTAGGSDDWDTEVKRFFERLADLDRMLADGDPPEGALERLIQGPLADALWHVGQLAMLRGMAGHPIRPESYARAEIVAGRVGLEQAAPGREYEGDASEVTRS